MKSAQFLIEGISCNACIRSIENIVASADDSAACTVDPSSGRAEIRFDPERTSSQALAELLTENGFDASVAHSD